MASRKKDGSAQLSRLALDRKEQASRLAAASKTQADAIEAEARKLVGEAAKGLGGFVLALGARAEALGAEVVKREHAHAEELDDDDAPRMARDRSEQALRDAITGLQEVLTGMYGAAALVSVKLAGTPPKTPRELSEWVKPAIKALSTLKAADLPECRIDGAKASPHKWHAALATPQATLSASLQDVAREETEAIETLARRNESVAGFDAFTPRAEALLDALMRFVGRESEADRLAPTARSRPKATGEAPQPDPGPAKPVAPSP